MPPEELFLSTSGKRALLTFGVDNFCLGTVGLETDDKDCVTEVGGSSDNGVEHTDSWSRFVWVGSGWASPPWIISFSGGASVSWVWNYLL